jgi:predicted permease
MNVISQVSILFILIFLGFCSAKLKITSGEIAGYFSAFILKITMPCMILVSFQRSFSRELLGDAAVSLVGACLIYGISIILAIVYPHAIGLTGNERGVHRYALIFSNSGFIGFPMVEAILGSAYLFHASIYNIPFNIFSYSLGAWFVAKEGKRTLAVSWKMFINPGIITTIIGFALFFFSVKLPDPLYRSLKLAGDITTPLAMMVIGITLAQTKVAQILGRWQIYLTCLFRLICLPALFGLICYVTGIRGPIMILLVILTAMPAGSTTYIMASVYDVAKEEASSIVFLSTLLCMITVPLTVFVLNLI